MNTFYKSVLLVTLLALQNNMAFSHPDHGVDGIFHGLFHQFGDIEYFLTFLFITVVAGIIFFFVFTRKRNNPQSQAIDTKQKEKN